MRIALVAMHFAEYSFHLAKALARDNDVLLLLESGNAKDELGNRLPSKCESGLRIELIEHRKTISAMLFNSLRIASIVREFRPDVVHFQEASAEYVIWAAWGLHAFPRILTIHDPIPHSGEGISSFSTLRHAINRRLLRSWCLVAITHGGFLVEEVELAIPRLKGNVYSVPHGPLGNNETVSQPEQGNLLFFGRIQKYKGLGYFVKAVKQLHLEGFGVKAVIAGRGEGLVDFRQEILAHPAFELHERFIGDDEVQEFFSKASVVVLPYTDGTQSGVAAMAMGFGRPVVASRVGSVPEMVRDGENGYLVPTQDLVALTDALRSLLTNPELVSKMGRQAKSLSETEMSWDRNSEITIIAYQRAQDLYLIV